MSEVEQEVKPKEAKKVPWTPIIIAGAVIGVGAFIVWLVNKWVGTPNLKQAMVIYEDYKAELADMEAWVERTNAGGRTPTDEETKVLDAMMSAMKLKEIEIKNLSESTFGQLTDFIKTAAQSWWLVPVVILTPIAGYMTFKLVKGWFDHRKPPPSGGFTCPVCGLGFSTTSNLKEHMKSHMPTTANLPQAQAEFQELGAWTHGAIAVDSELYSRIDTGWAGLSLPELGDIAYGAASLYGFGAAGTAELSLLQMLPLLLLV
jgi:hypothetical protein